MKKETITIDDFVKLDVRVGEVQTAEHVDGSEKLLSLLVDLGTDYGTVEILSGIAQFYSPEELVGKRLLFLANLAPRPMVGHTSHGMMLALDGDSKPILIDVSDELANGTRLR